MGGSSSINGQQWVRPSKQFLQQLFLASGEDADWRPSHVYDMLKVTNDPEVEGRAAAQAPFDPLEDGAACMLIM